MYGSFPQCHDEARGNIDLHLSIINLHKLGFDDKTVSVKLQVMVQLTWDSIYNFEQIDSLNTYSVQSFIGGSKGSARDVSPHLSLNSFIFIQFLAKIL